MSIQTLTYFTLGPRMLKYKLLPDYFATLSHHSDSIFVRDFFVSECYTGDPKIYSSQNLRNDKALIKEKFKVKYVHFDKRKNFSWDDKTEEQYNLVYNTWTARYDWVTLFNLYAMRQTETLLTDKRYFYKRETTYHWVLFFWIESFEWFESSDFKH